ncbi:alpha/beta fold hydrolase [Rhizobium sp.]
MSFRLSKISSFFIGGEVGTVAGQPVRLLQLRQQEQSFRADPNGEFDIGHLYVQEFRLAVPAYRLPVLLWHGGGLTGSVWEANAAGGPGWLTRLLERGHDVLASDAVGMGRSSWAQLPARDGTESIFRSKREAWELFRIGTRQGYANRQAFAGSQFPASRFDAFSKFIVPRWTGLEAVSTEAYCALVERVGPCVIVAHSSSALYAYEALARWPDLVGGICLIEPSFAPPWDHLDAVRILKDKPILHIYGDFVEENPYWNVLRQQAKSAATALEDSMRGTWIDLPAHGIRGNTHSPMSDGNSDQVARLIMDWLDVIRA